MTPAELAFIRLNPSGAMVTVGEDGRPKVARVSVGVVDGVVLSSGTAERVRTRRLRRDPRCTLFVFDGSGHWLGLEALVSLVEGEASRDLNLRLAREIQKRPVGPLTWLAGRQLDDDEFLVEMDRDKRLVYRFEVERSYGELGE